MVLLTVGEVEQRIGNGGAQKLDGLRLRVCARRVGPDAERHTCALRTVNSHAFLLAANLSFLRD